VGVTRGGVGAGAVAVGVAGQPEQGGAGGRQLGQFSLQRSQRLGEGADLLAELVRGQARDSLAGGDHLQDRCRFHVARQLGVVVPDTRRTRFAVDAHQVCDTLEDSWISSDRFRCVEIFSRSDGDWG
jgi:hypothetical protein